MSIAETESSKNSQPASDWAPATLFNLLARQLRSPLRPRDVAVLAERLVGLCKEQSLLLARLLIDQTHDRYPTDVNYTDMSATWAAIEKIDPWVKEDRPGDAD